MTHTRKQADTNTDDCNNDQNNRARREAGSSMITSLGHRSNGVHIGTSGDAYHFHGDVYIGGGGKKVKKSTVERYERRQRQKARRSAAISDAEREARREAQHHEWQARQERQRRENQSRWEAREMKEGRKLSKEEHMARDLEEEKEKASRKKSQRPLTSFFQPVVGGSQNVDCSASKTGGILTEFSTVDANKGDDRDEEPRANVEDCIQEESSFKQGMKVFLRLAFIDDEELKSLPSKDAKKHIREDGIIGKVIIEEMVARMSLD